jgi:hypothetical protein
LGGGLTFGRGVSSVEGSVCMSVYAFDPARREFVVVWPAAVGSQASVVASVGAGVSVDGAAGLCTALTRLSEAVWDTYVRPASAVVDDEQERSVREYEREQFDHVVGALREPNLPDESGMLEVSYSPVEESAHRLGRVLHELADAALADAVIAEVRVEIDAVTRAELGDLSGRAVQGAALDRLDVSPIQVAAAGAILQAEPLGGGLLAAAVDPAAACVAAAHWLASAAVVAAEEAGNSPAGVFAEADVIQAVSVEVPTLVVRRVVGEGATPRQVVLDLLRSAVAAADGVIADLPAVLVTRARLEESLRRLPAREREAAMAAEPARATLLDPRRPARDLLEHLLDGISSCQLLYADGDNGDDFDGADELDDPVSADTSDVDVVDAERWDEVAEEFAELVRAEAASTRDRLL